MGEEDPEEVVFTSRNPIMRSSAMGRKRRKKKGKVLPKESVKDFLAAGGKITKVDVTSFEDPFAQVTTLWTSDHKGKKKEKPDKEK